MDENKKTKMPFNIVPITDNNSQDVLSFIEKYFILDEPLNASVALFEEKDTLIKYKDICCNLFNNGLSFMAVSETGEMMGVTLNRTMCKDDLIVQYRNENFV
eukprot:XP_016660383.1 PREDICTED: uncharacterized protein LOC107883916 [Acyrthosiphon pisum]